MAASLAQLPIRKSRAVLLTFIFLFITISLYYISQNSYQLRNTLSYATRPLWDSEDGPKTIIPHYHAEGMGVDKHTCSLHGWEERQDHGKTKVLDAIMMSTELDLLEIRLNELENVVDRFFIIESNTTFTGLPKQTHFANNRQRFAKFEKKISYRFIPGPSEYNEKGAWDVEADTRRAMTLFLRSHMTEYLPGTRSLVIMSDIDEIPSAHSLALLRNCDFGQSIHLQLRNYLYSFEWFLGFNSWRASVHQWNRDSYYRHSMSGDVALADAGWHCSYCFRTIPEYVTKMEGFSHSDRIGGNRALLEPGRIQEVICKGKDIFGMLPEAYSYRDLFSQMSLEPLKTAVYLPRFLLVNAERFKFLLPGGCEREDLSEPTKEGAVVPEPVEPVFDDLE
ncbi:glycosyltransferase family 17 protein [Dendrothele bispora CBS 962.96]|uniref:Glycosyltransferase family 17 protein n=1 Tax=Dendrothele bispora (strain CBS 962.96) TaxID=1314807 RepID=A0A4S8L8H7_DENBC|nr:glycosyltransferase family 17 protein [Dendrothele bispora CBS 962.96]